MLHHHHLRQVPHSQPKRLRERRLAPGVNPGERQRVVAVLLGERLELGGLRKLLPGRLDEGEDADGLAAAEAHVVGVLGCELVEVHLGLLPRAVRRRECRRRLPLGLRGAVLGDRVDELLEGLHGGAGFLRQGALEGHEVRLALRLGDDHHGGGELLDAELGGDGLWLRARGESQRKSEQRWVGMGRVELGGGVWVVRTGSTSLPTNPKFTVFFFPSWEDNGRPPHKHGETTRRVQTRDGVGCAQCRARMAQAGPLALYLTATLLSHDGAEAESTKTRTDGTDGSE